MKRISLLTIIVILTLALCTSCFLVEEKSLVAPTVTLDGNTLTWNAVEGAEKYIVSVNGMTSETTQTTYTIDETKVGAYEIYVTAIRGEEKKTSDAVTYTIRGKLSAPTITISGNYVAWTEVENATGYEVFVNGESKGTQTKCSYAITSTDAGEYKITVKALCNGFYDASELSNEVVYTLKGNAGTELVTLDSPVITLTDGVLSWEAVEGASTYMIYVDGTKKYETAATNFRIPETFGVGEYGFTVVASNPTSEIHLNSKASNSVTHKVEALDLTKPLLSIFMRGDGYVGVIDSDGYLVIKSYDEVSDFTQLMWYLEQDGEYYNIKLYDGRYLAWIGANGDGSEVMAVDWGSVGAENLQWHFVETSDGSYKIYNVAHANRWSGGNWSFFLGIKRNDAGTMDVIKFGDNASTIKFANKNIPYTGPENNREEEKLESFYAWLYYPHNNGTNLLAFVDTDNILKVGVEKDTVADYNSYIWYFEYIEDGEGAGYYMIKLPDGRYLAQSNTNYSLNGHSAEVIATEKDENDKYQWWILHKAGVNQYKIENVGHSASYTGVYLGEWYGVIKFDGACNAWVFNLSEAPVIPSHTCENVCAECGKCTNPDCSETVCQEKCTCNQESTSSVDLTQPILATYTNNDGTFVAVVNDDNVLRFVKLSEVTDFTKSMFYLEADGEYYNIKLYNGLYLTWENASDGNETAAKTRNHSDNQKWMLIETADNTYKLRNLGHKNAWGDYCYGVVGELLKFGDFGAWVFENKDIPYVERDDSTTDTEESKNFSAWLYYPQNNGSKTLAYIDTDDILKVGVAYDSVTDYAPYTWTFEYITEGAGAGYYMIKLPDGRYLTSATTSFAGSGSDTAEVMAAEKNENDKKQWWILNEEGENQYKIQNVAVKENYSTVCLGEWWGVYKFQGCNAWVFTIIE